MLLCPPSSAPTTRSVTARFCPLSSQGGHGATASPLSPARPGAAGRTPRKGRAGRSHPGPAEPSPCRAPAHQHTRGREPSGSPPAPPRRSSPRYSGPGSESRSGLSILLLPLLPGFRPFPRRPTLPALLGRSPRLGTRPSPPQFRAHSRPAAPSPVPSGAGARLGQSPGEGTAPGAC